MANIRNAKDCLKTLNIDYQLVLLYRIALLMVLFSLSRLGFYFFNTEHFADMTFARFMRIMYGGLRFDLSGILFLNAFYIVLFLLPLPFRYNKIYQSVIKWIFLISNGVALASNVCDFFYFDFILKRTGADVFMFAKESNVLTLFKLFLIDYWQGPLIWITQLGVLVLAYNAVKPANTATPKRWAFYLASLAWLLISIYFSIIGMRGGFTRTTRPITIGNAGEYTEKPLEMAIVLNTPFTIIRTLERTDLPEKSYFSQEELKSIYQPIHKADTTKTFKPLNVVVLVMESFSKEFIGAFNRDLEDGKYEGYTPFLDSLIQHCRSYKYSYANGFKSIDALPSIVAGIPSLFQPYVTSQYAINDIISIGSLLKSKGYETTFFHGAPNGSMGFSSFMNVAGYDRSYGMEDYGNDADFDGAWGIWDEEFMLYMGKEFCKMKEPFHTVFFSVTSHHPYKIPEKYAGKFKKGNSEYAIPMQYSDMALRKFFKQASKESWFKNTVFILTADHTGFAAHREYDNGVGRFSVPIIFYHPGNPEFTGMDTTMIQQIDILPSVMSYLNFDQDFVAFGINVFDSSVPHFTVNFNSEYYQIIKGNYVLQFINEKTTAIYNYVDDRFLTNNLLNQIPEIQTEMEKLLKAFIQQYNNRILTNKLTKPE